jgi:hypothetical protein
MRFLHDFDESFLVAKQIGVDVDVFLLFWLDHFLEDGVLAWVFDSGAFVGGAEVEDGLAD